MKFLSLFSVLTFFLFVTMISCDSDGEAVKDAARESLGDVQPPAETPAQQTVPAQNASGVFHYTCPNNCEGGGAGSAGNCPVCGTALAHNAAYHGNTQQNTTPPPTTQPAQQTQPTLPAQNAAGVYHYICSAGCPGGAATAGNCSSCGGQLAHNTDYHN